MEEKLLSNYTNKQLNSMAESILFETGKTDWSADVYLSNIIEKIKTNQATLLNSIGQVRSSDFTEQLSQCDATFDKDFICFKNFVAANKYLRDDVKSEAAKKIWTIIASNDLRLYRLSYEEQTSSANSLFAELDKAENKGLLNLLIGVNEALSLVKESNDKLIDTYRQSKNAAKHEEDVSASLQSKLIRQIINEELLPYLNVMSKVNPDTYSNLHDTIRGYIEDVNIKARIRTTRNQTENLQTEEF